MLRFEALIEHSLVRAVGAGYESLAISGEFATCRKTMPSGELVLRTWCLASGQGGELRMASIESAKIHVVTCFLYPPPDRALPLYAMELVELGSKPIVAVLDLACPASDPAAAWAKTTLREAHLRHPELVNADDPPGWYVDCRSGADFFLRPQSPAQTDRMVALHDECVAELFAALDTANPRAPANQPAWARFEADYKAHHATHSPGLPLMQRSFGVAWTERYMHHCFFA